MTTNNRAVLDTLFLVTAVVALLVLGSVFGLAIIGGIMTGAVAGDTLGTPGLIVGFCSVIVLFSALVAVILDQTEN